MSISRKEFLRQGLQSLGRNLLHPSRLIAPTPPPLNRLYPPGFRREESDACRDCDRCISACPDGLLRKEEGGNHPIFEPARGGCNLCLLCAEACPAGVLATDGGAPKIGAAAVDNSRCLCQRGGCFSCLERCPNDALTITAGTGLSVDHNLCTGCGSCQYVCPLTPPAVAVQPIPAPAP